MSLAERDELDRWKRRRRTRWPPAAPPPVAGPIRVHGKFFFAGETKYFVKGVTYGPFARRQRTARNSPSAPWSSAISR